MRYGRRKKLSVANCAVLQLRIAVQAARVVELSVYCMEESARCHHELGQ